MYQMMTYRSKPIVDYDRLTLIHIAMSDFVPLHVRYEAARELQYRYVPEEIRADIIYRYGKGMTVKEIADENGLSPTEVGTFIKNMMNKKYSRRRKVIS